MVYACCIKEEASPAGETRSAVRTLPPVKKFSRIG